MPDSNVVAEEKQSRRFFFAGVFTFFTSFVLILFGAIRFIVPNVQYGKAERFKVGMPQDFPDKQATYMSDHQIYIVRDGDTFMAMSAICTHLGCAVRPNNDGPGFFCPCHGSHFAANGKNVSGPAPKPLTAYEVSLGHLGELIVDKRTTVKLGEKFHI